MTVDDVIRNSCSIPAMRTTHIDTGAMIGCRVPEKLQGKTGQTVKNNAEKERRQRGLLFFLPFPGDERRNETSDQEVQLHRVYR